MKNLKVTVNGVPYEVQIEEVTSQIQPTLVKPIEKRNKVQNAVNRSSSPANNGSANNNKKGLIAPMPGLIKQVKVSANQQVQTGDIILVLEAMKLENEIRAKNCGLVKEILVEEGQIVGQGAILVVIE